jgi:hypothetical protein
MEPTEEWVLTSEWTVSNEAGKTTISKGTVVLISLKKGDPVRLYWTGFLFAEREMGTSVLVTRDHLRSHARKRIPN